MRQYTVIDGYTVYAEGSTSPESVLLLLHGRGATAESIMSLTSQLLLPDSCLVLAPQAPQNTWYPERFIVPQSENEPHLTTAIGMLHKVIGDIEKTHQLSADKVFLAGFSQGACMVAEYLKRYPRQYQGAAIMSGGLIGTDDEVVTIGSDATLLQTPVYLGCDTDDSHIPVDRVKVTGDILTKLGATVNMRRYECIGHTIHPEAFDFISKQLTKG